MAGLTFGTIFENKYEILEVLGEGGMGVVYRARQLESNREIALKVLHAMLIKDEEHVKRFRREARAVSRLGHPNIVTFYHLGFTDTGVPYAAMEYLPGKSLSRILNDEDHLSIERCLRILKQICLGISLAHENGIMHRDLKPANILISDEPEPDSVKVVDFGLVKLTESSGMSTEKLTETGLLVGSFYYMSPEQVRGRNVDERSDIYACGCMMYECLTGQKPFDADTPVGVLHMHCTEKPARFSETPFGASCDEKAERVCRTAMAKDPNERYQTMAQLIQDIEVLQSGQGTLIASPLSADGDTVAPRVVSVKKGAANLRRIVSLSATLAAIAIIALISFAPMIRLPTKEQLVVAAVTGLPVKTYIDSEECQQGQKCAAWELIQENSHTGHWTVYLSDQGMVAVNRKMGSTLVSSAPAWNVVMYNDKTKVYFLSPLNEWKGAQSSLKQSAKTRQAYARATTSLIERPPQKIKDEMILGHNTSLYLTDNLVTTGLKKVEFSITPDIDAPAKLQTVFGKIYGVGLTKLKGLPLKVSYIDENGKRSPVFQTTRIEQKQVPLKYFSFPLSYKRVNSEIEVLMDAKGREAMANIMQDLEKTKDEDLDALLDEKHTRSRPKGKTELEVEE